MPRRPDPDAFRFEHDQHGLPDPETFDVISWHDGGEAHELLQATNPDQSEIRWLHRTSGGEFEAVPLDFVRDLLAALRPESRWAGLIQKLLGLVPDEPGEPSIDPETNEWTLPTGAPPQTEQVVVTIPPRPPAMAERIDLYFLADTTASMGALITEVQSALPLVRDALIAQGVDVAVGAGQYRDFFDADPPGPYTHEADPDPDPAVAEGVVNAWAPAGGGDSAESQLYALQRIADGAVTWRPDSQRVVLWFGDNPGHEPICPAISGMASPIYVSTVASALASQEIRVIATSDGNRSGLNGDPVPLSRDLTPQCGEPTGAPGQGTFITSTTGGVHLSGIDAGNLGDALLDGVVTATNSYDTVELVATGGSSGAVSAIQPQSYSGPFDATVKEEFTFEVTFEGTLECTFQDLHEFGALEARVDGVTVVQKPVHVIVPRCFELIQINSDPSAVNQTVWKGAAENNTPPFDIAVFARIGSDMGVAQHQGDPTDASNWRWTNLGDAGRPLVGRPDGLASDRGANWWERDYLQVFVQNDRDETIAFWWDGRGWSSTNLGNRGGARSIADPASLATRHSYGDGDDALHDSVDKARVFVPAVDGGVRMLRELAGGSSWHPSIDLGAHPDAATPVARGSGISKYEPLRVDYCFFIDTAGILYTVHSEGPDGLAWDWHALGTPPDVTLASPSSPSALSRTIPDGSEAAVFVRDSEPEPQLWLMQWQGIRAAQNPAWRNLGTPPGALIASSPAGGSLSVGGDLRLYGAVVDALGDVHVRVILDADDPTAAGPWHDIGSPPRVRAIGEISIAAHGYGEVDGLIVFARCTDNHLWMRAIGPDGSPQQGWRQLDRTPL